MREIFPDERVLRRIRGPRGVRVHPAYSIGATMLGCLNSFTSSFFEIMPVS